MFKVIDKLQINTVYCVSVEGDTLLLKKGLKLIDEKENVFEIETVAMTHYENIRDFRNRAELVLRGDVENIGEELSLYQ